MLCALVYAGVLVFALRLRAENGMDTRQGVVSRAVLSVLLLLPVALVWHYATKENMESAMIERWSRIISAVIYLGFIPQIWADSGDAEKREKE